MNAKLMKHWIVDNSPQGLEKLAIASGISSETLKRVMCGNYVIKTDEKLEGLANALGCTVEDLLKTDEQAS
jgi:transcriptional regulator with XRE-family HTH domain